MILRYKGYWSFVDAKLHLQRFSVSRIMGQGVDQCSPIPLEHPIIADSIDQLETLFEAHIDQKIKPQEDLCP